RHSRTGPNRPWPRGGGIAAIGWGISPARDDGVAPDVTEDAVPDVDSGGLIGAVQQDGAMGLGQGHSSPDATEGRFQSFVGTANFNSTSGTVMPLLSLFIYSFTSRI